MVAAVVYHYPLALFTVLVYILLTPTLGAQKIPPCGDELWSIQYEKKAKEGQAKLVITPSNLSNRNFKSVSTILTCTDLIVSGTGRSSITIGKKEKSMAYQIALPDPKTYKQLVKQGNWVRHGCVIQLTYDPASRTSKRKEVECAVQINTVLGRIIPRCDLSKGKPLLKKVQVKKKDGQVLLSFRNSANAVYTHDSKCEVGSIDQHNHTTALQENMIPLAPPGTTSPVTVIDYNPDCDNKTVFEKYKNMELTKCHIEIYQICQEGNQLVEYVNLEFKKGVLKCEKPKPFLVQALEKLELVFFIDSKPVVALVFLLCFNIALYLLLVPVLIWKMTKYCKGAPTKKKTKSVPDERKPLLQNIQSPPVSPDDLTPNRPLSPPPFPTPSVTTIP